MTNRREELLNAWNRAWGDGDVAAFEQIITPGYLRRSKSGSEDSTSVVETIKATHEAFPDFSTDILHIVEDGGTAARILGGATFLAAHVSYGGRPGVFARLSTLSAGDEVEIMLNDGASHRYRVTSTIEYALGTIDMGALLKGREGIESITLMTCSGPPNEGEYAFRTVVLCGRVE